MPSSSCRISLLTLTPRTPPASKVNIACLPAARVTEPKLASINPSLMTCLPISATLPPLFPPVEALIIPRLMTVPLAPVPFSKVRSLNI